MAETAGSFFLDARDLDASGVGGRAHPWRLRIAALVLIAGFAALALLASTPRTATAADAVTVRIGESAIQPATATIEPGGTVVWVNDATTDRSVVATDGSFDSGPLGAGEQFQFAFTEARTASYEVPEIPGATGTVVVEAAGTTAAVPGEAPAATSPTAPSGFAYTGASTAVHALIGGTIIALGAGLVMSARRFGFTGAFTGLPFAFVPDDLLPSRRHRRLRKEQSRRNSPHQP